MNKNIVKNFGCLRGIKDDELTLMLAWRNSPAVRENMYTRHEIGLAEHLQWWDKTKNQQDQQYFMYEYDGAPRGIVGFNGIDLKSSNSLWAFYADPEAPKGTGSRMEYLALEYAFNHINLHKLCCEVLAFNAPVIRLHEKFGFKVEGIFREQHSLNDGYVDIYRLGMLRAEWFVKREEMLNKLSHHPKN